MRSLMNHERKLFVKDHEGEQCNGFRSRHWYHGFEFSLRIPRCRSGNFLSCSFRFSSIAKMKNVQSYSNCFIPKVLLQNINKKRELN